MSGLVVSLLHHSESIDPTLADWLRHKIDDLLGLDPPTIAATLGILLAAFPLVLGALALRSRRRWPR
jgi:hypothetical protein